jgi:cytochrome c-type biogenesis protein CcmH
MRNFTLTRGNRLRLLSAVLLGVLILIGAGDNSARVEKLGHQMMCMCGCNQILLECNHVGCTYSERMRGELVAAVDAGSSDDAVLQTFIEKYGTTVLASPTHSGFDRVAWIMPYLALIVGVGGVALIVRAWHKRYGGKAVDATSGMSAADISRFRDQARKETDL